MGVSVMNSRDLPNTWRILDDKLGNFRDRGLNFKFPYVGAFSQSLAEYFIRVYSNPGDTILEPFGGRGTTAIQSLWHKRNIIINDMSPYSNVLCHSVLYTPYIRNVFEYLKVLEEYVLKDDSSINTSYAGKGTRDDVAKLYHSDTFKHIIKLRNLLNNHDTLLGKGFGPKNGGIENNRGIEDIGDYVDSITYEHEIIMFIRMVMSQCMLHNNTEVAFNGMKIRATDNTNIKALLRYYESIGESPQHVNIFDNIRLYIENMGLTSLGIRDKFYKLKRNLLNCDARKLDVPDKCADMILTSPPYFAVLNYGMANWARLWSINNIGDPLVGNVKPNKTENFSTSEIYGKIYDRNTNSTGSTLDNPMSYSGFTGQYLRELYRVLKDDAVCIIVVGDYGSKRKIEAWRLVADRAEILGFKPQIVIMDELNVATKSSSQFGQKHGGGKNDYDVCVILYKGDYQRKNDPESVDFRWGAKFCDGEQLSIESAWI